MNNDQKKKKKNYTRKLEEISEEFRFSDLTLATDKEIDDRHLLKDLPNDSDNDEDIKEP